MAERIPHIDDLRGVLGATFGLDGAVVDAIVVISLGAQAVIVGIRAAIDIAQHACDTIFSAIWESRDGRLEALRDGSTGEKRGGDHKGFHGVYGLDCDVRERIQANQLRVIKLRLKEA